MQEMRWHISQYKEGEQLQRAEFSRVGKFFFFPGMKVRRNFPLWHLSLLLHRFGGQGCQVTRREGKKLQVSQTLSKTICHKCNSFRFSFCLLNKFSAKTFFIFFSIPQIRLQEGQAGIPGSSLREEEEAHTIQEEIETGVIVCRRVKVGIFGWWWWRRRRRTNLKACTQAQRSGQPTNQSQTDACGGRKRCFVNGRKWIMRSHLFSEPHRGKYVGFF